MLCGRGLGHGCLLTTAEFQRGALPLRFHSWYMVTMCKHVTDAEQLNSNWCTCFAMHAEADLKRRGLLDNTLQCFAK